MNLSKAAFAFVICLSFTIPATLLADSFSVNINADNWGNSQGGTSYCAQSGASSANCSITWYANFSEGSATAQAMGGFGSLSGFLHQESGEYPHQLSYDASYSNRAIVTGATGSGTLIGHYQLTASGQAGQYVDGTYFPVLAANTPSFNFVQGSEHASFLPVLGSFGNCPGAYGNACYAGSFDVSSPVIFGDPIDLDAQTQASYDVYEDNTQWMTNLNASSTVTLTGFTVLDSAGNEVSDADFQFFVPEPSAIALGAIG